MSIELLFEQIETLLQSDRPRSIIGIVGKPGAGKSTVVEEIQSRFDSSEVCIIPMDGYHLSNEELIKLGRRDRKGAPDTFAVSEFIDFLKSVKTHSSIEHRFPIFHREIEASVAGEGVVPTSSRVIVTEGNYLFSEEHNWGELFQILDHSWFIEIDDEVRLERLIARHIRYGKTPEEAKAWSLGSDESNARFIELTAHRAENIIKVR